MITILHGDNTVQSRNKLAQFISLAKNKKQDIIRLEAKKTTLPELEQMLGSNNLFGNSQLIIVEALHSLPQSKRKNDFIDLIAQTSQSSQNMEIILWEKRALTPTMLKKFPKNKEEHFKLTNQLFKWLDSLSPNNKTKTSQLKNLHKAIEDNGEHMCFVMLIRQIRLLIQAKDGGNIKGPPFMISKLKKQAQDFSLDMLLDIYRNLLQIDLKMKTSQNQLSLAQSLDLFIVNL